MKETEMRRVRRNESAPLRSLNDAKLECVNTESATASKLNIQKHEASNIDPAHVGHASSNFYAIKTERNGAIDSPAPLQTDCSVVPPAGGV